MRYDSVGATDDWQLLEVARNGKHPCSDEYADANLKELADIFAALRLLRAAGCPPDRLRGSPEIEAVKHKCPGCHAKETFFILKAKPSGWRLYFRIKDREKRQIEFLYAVNKKRNERNQEDLNRCCKLLADINAGRTGADPIFIPNR